jgi:hypothetical protein
MVRPMINFVFELQFGEDDEVVLSVINNKPVRELVNSPGRYLKPGQAGVITLYLRKKDKTISSRMKVPARAPIRLKSLRT